MAKYNIWTPEQILTLTQTEGEYTAEELANQLGKTKYMVSKKAKQLGIVLLKRYRLKSAEIYFNGSPCLIFMTVEQMCRTGAAIFKKEN